MKLTAPLAVRLADADAERVRRSHEERIRELQALPAAGLVVLQDIELADGVATRIVHKLGKAPRWIGPSVVRGATTTGRIVESRDSGNRQHAVTLTATGWGATITIDLLAMP